MNCVSQLFKYSISFYICVCVRVCMHAHAPGVFRYAQKSEEGFRCPRSGGTFSWEPIDIGSWNWTRVFYKKGWMFLTTQAAPGSTLIFILLLSLLLSTSPLSPLFYLPSSFSSSSYRTLPLSNLIQVSQFKSFSSEISPAFEIPEWWSQWTLEPHVLH